LFVFAAIYGSGSAGLQSMFPAGLSSLTTDMRKQGTRMGMGFSIVSFACLTGPPLAGALITHSNGNYLPAQIWGGTSFVLGAALLFAARTAKVGFHLVQKV
jgi:MFS family permease